MCRNSFESGVTEVKILVLGWRLWTGGYLRECNKGNVSSKRIVAQLFQAFMSSRREIPLVEQSLFREQYFDHPAQYPTITDSNSYFEMERRCILKNQKTSHRINFYMIFIITKGQGIYRYGHQEYLFRDKTIGFVGPEVVNSWKFDSVTQEGFFCVFSDAFVNQGRTNKAFLQELPFFQINTIPSLSLDQQQNEKYLTVFRLMWNEYINRNKYSDDVLRSQLQLILHMACAQLKADAIERQPQLNSVRLVNAFKALYLSDFKELSTGVTLSLKTVSDYARQLGVSQNHLNDIAKRTTGRSAGQLIKDHLISHATTCLLHSHKSIGEIAYSLGFEDPSYFSRFYKSKTGKSPTQLRASKHN